MYPKWSFHDAEAARRSHHHVLVGGRPDRLNRTRAVLGCGFAVEGFSEAMATEMAPHGVKVTIIEPGGFRTDFAGSSTTIQEVRAEYDATVGEAACFQRRYNGRQPGDPKKAAQVILEIVAMKEPPLRLLLGSDAVKFVEAADIKKSEADKKWRDLSMSTDFGEDTSR
jgi:hypothetical protein